MHNYRVMKRWYFLFFAGFLSLRLVAVTNEAAAADFTSMGQESFDSFTKKEVGGMPSGRTAWTALG